MPQLESFSNYILSKDPLSVKQALHAKRRDGFFEHRERELIKY
jgi:hypothetical protein